MCNCYDKLLINNKLIEHAYYTIIKKCNLKQKYVFNYSDKNYYIKLQNYRYIKIF